MTVAPGATNYGVEATTPSASTNSTSVSNGLPWSICINGGGGAPQANLYSLNAQSVAATASYNGFGAAMVAAEGGVPTVALGLPNDLCMTAGVIASVTQSMSIWTVPGSFSAMPAGALCGPSPSATQAAFSSGACVNTARSSGAIYALISHGANGYGGYTQNGVMSSSSFSNANEQINCHYSSGACTVLVGGTPQPSHPFTYSSLPLISRGRQVIRFIISTTSSSTRNAGRCRQRGIGRGRCAHRYGYLTPAVQMHANMT